MTTTIDGIVHTDAVHHQKYTIGFETSQHRTPGAGLTFLNKNLTGILQHIRGSLRIGEFVRFGTDTGYPRWNIFNLLFPAAG